MLSINSDNTTKQIPLFEIKQSKHKFEYQEVCEELEPTYGKLIWTLPHKVGFTEYKIREAHKVCIKRNILTFKYLYGVLRKMP